MSVHLCPECVSAYTEHDKWEEQQQRRKAFREVKKNVDMVYLIKWDAMEESGQYMVVKLKTLIWQNFFIKNSCLEIINMTINVGKSL